MKYLIIVIIVILLVVGFLALKPTEAPAPSLLQECPDEKIVNKMPGPNADPNGSAYYIKNGERREITEFDSAWVGANCNVPIQEVF